SPRRVALAHAQEQAVSRDAQQRALGRRAHRLDHQASAHGSPRSRERRVRPPEVEAMKPLRPRGQLSDSERVLTDQIQPGAHHQSMRARGGRDRSDRRVLVALRGGRRC
ncbi:MAG: hypothetical protein ACK56I_18120, partial [bacterium]